MRLFSSICLLCATCVLLVPPEGAPAAELNAYPDTRLLEADFNDGDSFLVDIGGTNIVIRLYFVDCPEKYAESDTQARRVREQARYFGLEKGSDVFSFGREAHEFMKKTLSRPFTLHTAFAQGGGSSRHRRYLGIITTSEGDHFARLLVGKGLARTRGTGRPTPDGISQAENWEQLRDLESSAMLERHGIWARSNAARLPKQRSAQREEERALRAVVENSRPTPSGTVDINHASRDALTQLSGIGPVMAEKIIEGRPYKDLRDLEQVKGIGEKTFQRLEHMLTLGPEE